MAKTINPKFIKEVIELTNKERQRFGLAPLEENKKLNKAAQGHSKNMALDDFFAHTAPDGSSPGDRIEKTGYKVAYWGENIAAGYSTPESAVEGWMDSDGHRAGILSSSALEIGVGYYFLKNDTGAVNYSRYWTQVFGSTSYMNGGNGNDYLESGDGDDILKGGKGKDLIFGYGGDDTIEGENGKDGLSGNSGNDYLIGGKGNDVLWGDEGSDTLIGVAPKAARPGKKERDTLTGGDYDYTQDVFVLGDRQKVFYDDGKTNNLGKGDYALIRNFETEDDIIELHGKATDYTIKKSPRGMPSGNAIFLNTSGKDELIAIVERSSWESDLVLNGDYFKFV